MSILLFKLAPPTILHLLYFALYGSKYTSRLPQVILCELRHWQDIYNPGSTSKHFAVCE